MMNKNLFLIVLSLVLSTFAIASEKEKEVVPPVTNMSISGVITDIDTEETLAGVLVSIEGTDLQTLTDLNGKFSFDGLEVAEYDLKLTYISYKEVEVKDIDIKSHDKSLELKLESE